MRALVTGAGGFIGSHLAGALAERGHEVRALVRYNSRGSWGHLHQLDDGLAASMDVRLGDVTDPYSVRRLVQGCDVVFHLAALIGIPFSYEAPASYVATNVIGTVNILEAARAAGISRIVVTSTSEVYGTALYTPIDELHPLQAQSPYSASKIAADKLAESYFRSFDLPVVTLRPFNTYGPRQSGRAIIPTILGQVLTGASEIELGNLEPRRDLTFVDDTVGAFIAAGEKPEIEGETIHVGQGTAVAVSELAELCLRAAGREARIVSVSERRRPPSSEVELLQCDPRKAERLLGWKPAVSLDDGLRRVVDYLVRHLEDYRPESYEV